MAAVHKFGNVTIKVYGNDHLPPHFHIITPDLEALVAIETMAVLQGKAEPKALMWAEANKELIKAEWNRCNPRFPC